MNRIEIPAKIFNNIIFQNGGQKKEMYKDLTGQYIQGLPEQVEEEANAEIEDQEYVNTKGKVVKAEGNTHEEGGIPVKLDDGDRVLSDHLKVGKTLAKELSKAFDVKINPTDTYSKVLDKYLKKIGHTEATDEVAKYVKKLDEQNKTVKDQTTLGLNAQYLMNEIKEEGDKLEELAPKKQAMFDYLFQEQEKSKGSKKEEKKFQNGGMQDLMIKYNITPEKMKILFQDGGGNPPIDKFGNPVPSLDKYKNAITLGELYGENRKYTPQEKEAIKKYYSTVVKDKNSLKVLFDRLDTDTLVFNQNLLDEVQTNKNIPLQYQSETEKNLYGVQTDSRLKDYLYASDFERKFGRPFGTDRNDEALIYDQVISDLEKEGVKYEGSPVTKKGTKLFGNVNAGKPKFVKELPANQEYSLDVNKFKNSTPEQQKLLADSLGIGLEQLKQEADKTTTAYINFKPINQTTQSGNPVQIETQSESAPQTVYQTEEAKRRANILALPERMFQNPQLLAPMKFNATVYGGNRVEISPEQQLSEINRQQTSTINQVAQLPDAQRASVLGSLDANYAMASSKAVADAERYNAQARERENYENAQVKTQQSDIDAQAASQYQQLLGRELESYQNKMQNLNNDRFYDQFNKWMTVNQYNRNNALNHDIQFTGSEYIVNPLYAELKQKQAKEMIDNLNKKPQAKKGGRFNKKRFGQ